MRKTYKFRLYPTTRQEQTLDAWLYRCHKLYNALLEQRKIAYRQGRKINIYDQKRELVELKAALTEYTEIGSHVLQDVCYRLERSFQRFFAGAGFPKFQGRNRFNSFTFPDKAGWELDGEHLKITNCGSVWVRLHRPIEGTIKTVTIKRRAGQWYACFSCDNVPAPPWPEGEGAVGIDLGIEALATTSDGERFPNARHLKAMQKRLLRTQRHLARQKKGSKGRRKTVRQLQRLHLKVANQRADAHHKVSTVLVRRYAEIHMERIDPQFMLKDRRLAKAASDAGWGQFKILLQNKAAAAGRIILEKSPRNTSQECSGCGRLVPKKLSRRWHQCECGTSLHRDHNAALVILRRPA